MRGKLSSIFKTAVVAVLLTAMVFALPAFAEEATDASFESPSPTEVGETAAPAVVYSEGYVGEIIVRIQLRLRELGYFCFKPTGAYRSMTVKAIEVFQKRCSDIGNSLAVDGRIGPETMRRLFEKNAPKVRIPDSVHIPKGPTADRVKQTGQIMQWSEVKKLLVPGSVLTVTDCYTGKTFELVFAGGNSHAEMELAAASEKDVFDTISGSAYNFLKRPVLVMINGVNVAASMQCWPHGSDTRDNNGMDGHVCVYFEGSCSHVGTLPDLEHAANIKLASGR